MNSDPQKPVAVSADPWPYPARVYLLRILWRIVWATVWKLGWRRIPILRCLLLRLFGARAPYCALLGSTWVEMPWDLELGHGVVVGPRTHLYNLGGLSVGDHTVISQDVYVCGGTHDYTDPAHPLVRKRIVIGRNVWIAAGAFIHPGVTIGDGAVVGARAVVTRDVEPWTVVAGNPAVFIKRRVMRTAPAAAPLAPQAEPPELSATP